MTASVVSQISITASRQTVFKYLSDSDYHFLWNPHLHSLTPSGPLKLGSKYKTTSLLLGVRVQGLNVVTKFLPAKEIQLKNDTGLLNYNVNYRLRTKDKMTQVICKTEVTADAKAFAFTAPLLRLLAKRELQSDLQALKIAVENRL